MIRACLIPVCRTPPVWVVLPSPAVAGVAGAGACGTHVTRVMRMTMADHSTGYVRVRLIGVDVVDRDESVSADHHIGGGAGHGD